MRAALIFSSTSHSINVQKVVTVPGSWRVQSANWTDLQNCPIQSVRLEMHDPRNRKRRRAAPFVSVGVVDRFTSKC